MPDKKTKNTTWQKIKNSPFLRIYFWEFSSKYSLPAVTNIKSNVEGMILLKCKSPTRYNDLPPTIKWGKGGQVKIIYKKSPQILILFI